jgi:hypothetical protein
MFCYSWLLRSAWVGTAASGLSRAAYPPSAGRRLYALPPQPLPACHTREIPRHLWQHPNSLPVPWEARPQTKGMATHPRTPHSEVFEVICTS